MKKIIALGLLILAFAATSYAQAPKLEFGFSGFIDAITEYWRTAAGNAGGGIYDVVPAAFKPYGQVGSTTTGYAFNKKNAYMESRFRLKFDAKMGKELSGTIFFEGDASRWGNLDGTRNAYGFWSGDRAALEVKNVYFDASLPYMGIPVPIQLRVGLQPFSIRNKLLIYTDGMGVTPAIKIDPVNVELYWFKAIEGKDFTADDVDIYGFQLNGKVDTYTLGGYWVYYNMNSYPFNSTTMTPFADTPYEAGIWWAGVYLDGKAGPVNVNFDFIYDYGKVKGRPTYLIAPDVKYRGWVGYLKVDYPYDMFNFGGVVMYATGADKRDTSASGLPGTVTASGVPSDKVTSFIQPPGSESAAIFGESLVFYSSWANRGNTGIANTLNYNQVCRGGVGGTWMAKAYASYKATPWYKITLAGLYIGDTTKHGDTIGTAMNATRTGYKNNSTIGWEFDLYNEFQIYKNLKWTAAGGLMFAKDGFKFYDPVFDRNRKPSNPWIITTNLTYNF
jgi:hypothetical protein